jgi:hypothetical protein
VLPTSLDSLKHNRNRKCGKWTLAGPALDEGSAQVAFVRLDCKAWSCAYCGPRKAARLQRAICAKAIECGLNRFLTLTLDPKLVPKGLDETKYIRNVWAKFRVYLKRKFGKSIVYISVLEFQESGMPHLHILVDRYISHDWISHSWESLGGGKIVYIERIVDLHRVGSYLSKYLTKDAILSAPSGVRRWTTSRGIRLFEKKASEGWRYLRIQFTWLYELMKGSVLKAESDCDGFVRFFSVSQEFVQLQ